MKCPRCAVKLERIQAGHRVYWTCGTCEGRVLSISTLRRLFMRDVIDRMWRRAVTNDGIFSRSCPDCRQKMIEVAAGDSPTPRVEVCRTCHIVWFDAGETAALTPLPAMTIERRMPQKAQELLAMARLERMARGPGSEDWTADGPDTWWKILGGIFGMPVKFDERTPQRRPWATWILCSAIAIVSIAAFPHIEEVVSEFGFIPADAWRHGGATWLTAFFLHGDILHLVGNLYFLLIFGGDVEDYCRPLRYVLLLLVATLAGSFTHFIAGPGSQIPCIGASGGISGIIVFYALKFPRARLGLVWRYSFQLKWMRMPAWFALVLWCLLQLAGLWQQAAGISDVSAAAHLGGALAGFCAWLVDRMREDSGRNRPDRPFPHDGACIDTQRRHTPRQ